MSNILADGVYWTGYVDKDIRDFHGYRTDRGSTYNSYLVCSDKTVLVDTVKAQYADKLVDSVRSLLKGRSLDYVICNHAEPDHSGGLPYVMKAFPAAELVCNAKCRAALEKHYNCDAWNFRLVTDGDSLPLGGRSVTFVDTPMVHWPESMFSFLQPDGILFSMDAFGQHFASDGRFDDEEDLSAIMREAMIYYANIVMLYGKQIGKVLDKASGLDIRMVAPSHGIIWRSSFDVILEAYRHWIICASRPKVLVVYDTMWGSTGKMAEAIADGARAGGVDVKLISIRKSHITEIATEMLDAAVLACGSPTLNMTMMPEVAAVLTYLKGLRPVNKAGRAFGSYGWGKGGAEEVHEYLEKMGFEIIGAPLKSQFVPVDSVLEECRQAGKAMAEKALLIATGRTA